MKKPIELKVYRNERKCNLEAGAHVTYRELISINFSSRPVPSFYLV